MNKEIDLKEYFNTEEYYNTKTGTKCGNCNEELTYATDAGTGFCKKCEEKKNNDE